MTPRQEDSIRKRPGRAPQRDRTRRDLLDAARALVSEGLAPGVAETADRAGISRTTAYRYFASQQALLVEAAVEPLVAQLSVIVKGLTVNDPVKRVDEVFRRAVPLMLAREAQLTMMLTITLGRSLRENLASNAPLQSVPWIDAFDSALEPIRHRVNPRAYVLMTRSISTLLGIEALLVFKDACDGDSRRTVAAARNAATAMVRGFLQHIEFLNLDT